MTHTTAYNIDIGREAIWTQKEGTLGDGRHMDQARPRGRPVSMKTALSGDIVQFPFFFETGLGFGETQRVSGCAFPLTRGATPARGSELNSIVLLLTQHFNLSVSLH